MGTDTTGTGPDTSAGVDTTTKDTVDTSKDTGKDGETGNDKVKDAVKDDDHKELKDTLTKVRKERDALVKAQRDAELAKLPELERATAQVAELSAANEKLEIENRRYKVAMKLGLPWSIGKRLTGETDEEMEADGAELAKSYSGDAKKVIEDTKNKRPPNDAKKTGGTSSGVGMNDILRALRKG